MLASTLLALQAGCERKPAGPPPPEKLVVLHALWGALYDGLTTDVTTAVAGMVQGEALHVVANASSFGDPAPGKIKYLRVVYSKGTAIGKKIVSDGNTLAVAQDEKTVPIRLMVATAEYGNFAAGKTIDLGLRLADMVKNDTLSVGNYHGAFGDPAPGKSKELRVDYVVDFQIRKKIVPETETLTLSAELTGR